MPLCVVVVSQLVRSRWISRGVVSMCSCSKFVSGALIWPKIVGGSLGRLLCMVYLEVEWTF
jgi:hypothetical protein